MKILHTTYPICIDSGVGIPESIIPIPVSRPSASNGGSGLVMEYIFVVLPAELYNSHKSKKLFNFKHVTCTSLSSLTSFVSMGQEFNMHHIHLPQTLFRPP